MARNSAVSDTTDTGIDISIALNADTDTCIDI
jgi:hypothetical protein